MSIDTESKPSLYERLGGVYSIAAVVDDLIERVMNNPVLNANASVDEAHHRVPAAGFKYLVTEMVCWAAGGPQKYTGRTMVESHKDLGITSGEWAGFIKNMQETFDKFKVPEAEQKELFAIVDTTRGDIVTGSDGPAVPAPKAVKKKHARRSKRKDAKAAAKAAKAAAKAAKAAAKAAESAPEKKLAKAAKSAPEKKLAKAAAKAAKAAPEKKLAKAAAKAKKKAEKIKTPSDVTDMA